MAIKNEKTKVPGVYRRGNRYVYSYRAQGHQRWGSATSGHPREQRGGDLPDPRPGAAHRDRHPRA